MPWFAQGWWISGRPSRQPRAILRAMRIHLGSLGLVALLALGCGGPSAPLPSPRGRGGSGGLSSAATGGAPSTTTSFGGMTARGGAATGGQTSTYVEPTCPDVPTAQIEAQCDAFDQSTCPEGQGCYPTIEYPTAPCVPEVYRTLCLPAGKGQQWEECLALLDCAPGFICVVSGSGTQCERACDANVPTSCPKGLFCEPIDLPGIGTCD
jgi:hypothetical protein